MPEQAAANKLCHSFSKWENIISISLQFMKLRLWGSDTGLLFPMYKWHGQGSGGCYRRFSREKSLCCAGLYAAKSCLVLYHTSPKQHVCCKKLPITARDRPRQNIPDTLLAAAAKEGILKGKPEGSKKRPLVTSSDASEDYSGNGLLLCVIILEFLCQGSFWSTARAC